MIKIGLLKEGKIPPDNRVALTPAQCKWIQKNHPGVKVVVQSSPSRSYTDAEYEKAGMTVTNDLRDCDVLLGIKKMGFPSALAGKTYLFFSHTSKKQPYNQPLMHAMLEKKITL